MGPKCLFVPGLSSFSLPPSLRVSSFELMIDLFLVRIDRIWSKPEGVITLPQLAHMPGSLPPIRKGLQERAEPPGP